jgi:hypothetical protein
MAAGSKKSVPPLRSLSLKEKTRLGLSVKSRYYVDATLKRPQKRTKVYTERAYTKQRTGKTKEALQKENAGWRAHVRGISSWGLRKLKQAFEMLPGPAREPLTKWLFARYSAEDLRAVLGSPKVVSTNAAA